MARYVVAIDIGTPKEVAVLLLVDVSLKANNTWYLVYNSPPVISPALRLLEEAVIERFVF